MESQPPMEYQISGVLMLISGLFNGLISMIYVFMLIWVCVGVIWLIPALIALGEVIVGLMVLTGARVPGVQVVSALGILNAIMLCNIWGAVMEGVAIVLQIQPKVTGYLAEG